MEDYGIQLTKEEEDKVNRLCESIRNRVAKERMTPRQRIEAVKRGEQPDRIPIEVNAVGLHSAVTYGVMPPDLYSDPKVSLLAYLTHIERFGYDTLSPFRFSIGEKEFGGILDSAAGSIPTLVDSPVKTAADLDKIKFPNVRKDGQLPWELWMISALKDKLGDIMPIYGFTAIPGGITPVILPMQKLFLALRNNPELAHCLAALTTKHLIDFVNAMFDAGADMVRLVGVDDQVSYKQHREFEYPYVAALVKSVKGPVAIRGAEDWTHTLDSHAEAGVEGFYAFSGQPLDKAKEWSMRHKTMLRYGINAQLLVHGPAEKIREEVKRIVKIGAPGGHFCLATDALDYSTPAEHLDVFMEAAKEYGQLPLKF
ncbi:hypothetical protein JCM15765_38570 [Paradesulfitobacterium aromaticivorans]